MMAGLSALLAQVAIEAVDTDVELAVLEPGVLDLARRGVPDVSARDWWAAWIQSSVLACSSQKPSGSLIERSYIAWYWSALM